MQDTEPSRPKQRTAVMRYLEGKLLCFVSQLSGHMGLDHARNPLASVTVTRNQSFLTLRKLTAVSVMSSPFELVQTPWVAPPEKSTASVLITSFMELRPSTIHCCLGMAPIVTVSGTVVTIVDKNRKATLGPLGSSRCAVGKALGLCRAAVRCKT